MKKEPFGFEVKI